MLQLSSLHIQVRLCYCYCKQVREKKVIEDQSGFGRQGRDCRSVKSAESLIVSGNLAESGKEMINAGCGTFGEC